MKYKIRATYKPTGKRVWASTRRFKNKKDAKEYKELVLWPGGERRFKNIRYIKIK